MPHGRLPSASAGSTTTRSNRTGSRGTGVPSGKAPGRAAHMSRGAGASVSGGRPSPRAGRSRATSASAPRRHERRRRTRVDRHEIELVATDMDVPGHDGPTGSQETDQDQRFGGVTCLLSSGPSRRDGRAIHTAMMPHGCSTTTYRPVAPRLIWRPVPDLRPTPPRGRAGPRHRVRRRRPSPARAHARARSWSSGEAAGSPSRSKSS